MAASKRNPWNAPGRVRVYLRSLEQEYWTIESVERKGDLFTIVASTRGDDGYWEGNVWVPSPYEHWLTDVVRFVGRNAPVVVVSSEATPW